MDSLPSEILCHSLDITSITADPDIQPRIHLDQSRVIQYAQILLSGVDLEPVVTFFDEHVYWLSDGFHRVAAYIHADRTQIPSEIRHGTRRDAILYGIERNAMHGLLLSLEERKNAARKLLMDNEWRLWSNRKIGRLCGLNHETVNFIKSDIALQYREIPDKTAILKNRSDLTPQLLQSVSGDFRQIQNFTNPSETISDDPNSQLLQSVSGGNRQNQNFINPSGDSASASDPELLQSVSGEITQIQNFTNPSETISDDPNSQLLQSVSGGNRQNQNFTNPSEPHSKIRKAIRGGKEYTIDTSNIGIRNNKRSESPATSTRSESSDLDLADFLSDFPVMVDDTSVLPSLTAQSLRNDPQVLDTSAVTVPETLSSSGQAVAPFSLLNIDCDARPTSDHLLEYDLKLVASGPPNAFPVILEQMRRVPQFAESVWQQAQHLANVQA
ncbi:MAG: hypothetical protein WCD18_05635 [Thermosynechococcaceae cyanobacterium]